MLASVVVARRFAAPRALRSLSALPKEQSSADGSAPASARLNQRGRRRGGVAWAGRGGVFRAFRRAIDGRGYCRRTLREPRSRRQHSCLLGAGPSRARPVRGRYQFFAGPPEVIDGVAVVRLDNKNAKMNTLSPNMQDEAKELWQGLVSSGAPAARARNVAGAAADRDIP